MERCLQEGNQRSLRNLLPNRWDKPGRRTFCGRFTCQSPLQLEIIWDVTMAMTSAVGSKTTTLELEGLVDDEPPEQSTTKSVGLEELTSVKATGWSINGNILGGSTNRSWERNSNSAGTSGGPNTNKVHQSWKEGIDSIREVWIWIDLNPSSFSKELHHIRKGIDICDGHGSATKTKNRAVSSMISSVLMNPKLTSHQIVFALRKASVHPKAFKSRFDWLQRAWHFETHYFQQRNKFLAGALKSGVSKGRVSYEQSKMANAVFVTFSDSPQDLDSDDEQRKDSPSKRQRLSLLPSVLTSTDQLKFKKMESKRKSLILRNPTKEEWRTVTRRKGKGLKVS